MRCFFFREKALISDGKNIFPIFPFLRSLVCMCVNEEQFTTPSKENLVETREEFNDTTGFIFSTAA